MLTVHFVGPIRRPTASPMALVDAGDTGIQTVAELLTYLGYDVEEQRRIHVLVDGRRRHLEDPLEPAQTVEILVAIGGG